MSEMMQVEKTVSLASAGKWKPYPAYKDSGVEWLGKIPEHWEVRRAEIYCCLSHAKSWS